jgi:hypothetical protein
VRKQLFVFIESRQDDGKNAGICTQGSWGEETGQTPLGWQIKFGTLPKCTLHRSTQRKKQLAYLNKSAPVHAG